MTEKVRKATIDIVGCGSNKNPKAIALHRRNRFEADGVENFSPAHGNIRAIRLVSNSGLCRRTGEYWHYASDRIRTPHHRHHCRHSRHFCLRFTRQVALSVAPTRWSLTCTPSTSLERIGPILGSGQYWRHGNCPPHRNGRYRFGRHSCWRDGNCGVNSPAVATSEARQS